jgi:hypothetical protein
VLAPGKNGFSSFMVLSTPALVHGRALTELCSSSGQRCEPVLRLLHDPRRIRHIHGQLLSTHEDTPALLGYEQNTS